MALVLALLWAGMLAAMSQKTGLTIWAFRATVTVLLALLAFGLAEQWPAHLPRWLVRWVWQLLSLVVAVPVGTLIGYQLTTDGPLLRDLALVGSYVSMTFMGLLFGPWVALAAMVRQREALARTQQLSFDLERSEFERQALDARLRLLQAQVEPHFLFNTLANVRALVNVGSPRASPVLDSLIAYLRAAVPRLQDAATTLEQELQLVRAYLELMHMRMPDRLQYSVHADPAAMGLHCPPMTLLTLVENAVRHGIDPSEDGGRIDVRAQLADGRCVLRVTDTGVGLGPHVSGLGTGLATLRERLQLMFAGRAQLRLAAAQPHGVCAELDLPAEPAA